MITFLLSLLVSFTAIQHLQNNHSPEPVQIAVAGLTHDHVHWIFGRDDVGDIEITGIYEPNRELWERYKNWYDLDDALHYTDLETMLDEAGPEAVTAFGSTYEHLRLVEASAPRRIHVMVEKPLAVNMEHARQMQELALENNIHLITNYETSWYSGNHEVYRLFKEQQDTFGEIRKMVVHDGHQGPQEIGVSPEFLEWLTDPVLNGGGALMDFGCYGANLMTWMMDGEEPVSVTAVTQTHKPHIYAEVDDEATIIVEYERAQGVIQASWNWPYNRKDMHVYGVSGFAYALDDVNIRVLEQEGEPIQEITLDPASYPENDPFSYFAAVVRGDIVVDDTDLSSLPNNMTVTRILDAARKSAETGERIYLNRD